MNKHQLVTAMYEKLQYTKDECYFVVNKIIDIIIQELKDKKRVEIRGFGVLKTRHRKARLGKNPKTNDLAEIQEADIPKYYPSKLLSDL